MVCSLGCRSAVVEGGGGRWSSGVQSGPREWAAPCSQPCKLLRACSLGIKCQQTDFVHKSKIQEQADTGL